MAANAVRKQLRDLGHKIGPTLQPVFLSKKLGQDLKPKEIKPSIVNKQCVVYHQRIAEHKNSAIGRHFSEAHDNNNLLKENQFTVLRKCQGKFDCLVFKMLFI